MATIQGVYVALFGRPADPTGLAYFNGVTKNGADLSGIGDLASTQEYKDRFKDQTNAQIVNSIYQSLFNRDAEAAGLNFFVDALNKGTLNIKNIAIAILDGAQGTDKTIVTNKITAADNFTKATDTPTEIANYTGNTAAQAGRDFLKTVTADTTTIPSAAATDTAIANIATTVNKGNTLDAANFTAGANTITVGSVVTTGATQSSDKNDTFNATTVNTYNPATDKIDGGFGTDTLNATINGTAAGGTGVVVADGLKSVELAFIKSVTAASTLDVANAKELQQVWDDGSAKALTVSNVALSTTVGLKGAITELTTFGFAGATGTSDTATLVADGATSTVGTSIAAIETLNIATVGTTKSSLGTITAADAKVVNLSGAAELVLTLADGAATTVNNTSTGAVDVTLSAATKLVAYNGSAAVDTVTIDTVGLTANVTVNTGAGADLIKVGTGAPSAFSLTLTGGDGSDKFLFTAAPTNIKTATAADFQKSMVTISDFSKTADAVDVKVLARETLDNSEVGAISGKATLFEAVSTAATYIDTGGKNTAVFTYGSDTYVLYDADGSKTFNDGDGLIKIAGVAAADLTATNFLIS